MMLLKKLDDLRKKIMPKLTENIGKSHRLKKRSEKVRVKTVLICRPNQRLGNLLLLTPLLQEITKSFPGCEIDIVVKGKLAGDVFKEYKNISNIIVLPRKPFKELLKYLNVFFSVKTKKYDLAINGAKGSSSGKILTYLSNSDYKIYGEIITHKEKDYQHMGKNNIYNLKYYFQQLGYFMDTKTLPLLDIKLSKSELLNGKEILSSCVSDSTKKTILIFTFATGAKCHSKEWWNEFYEKLVASFGASHNILEVLPMENVSQIDFKASSYYSKSIREIAAVTANASVFIGADSGIMHLASASKVATIGLFSVTREDMYSPYGNGSFSFNTNNKTTTNLIQELTNLLGSE